MIDRDDALAQARAAADQQYEHVKASLDVVPVARARALLATEGEADTWAIVGLEIARSLGLTTKEQQFAAELLAAAAIRIAKTER